MMRGIWTHLLSTEVYRKDWQDWICIDDTYARKIAIWRMHYTQLESVKQCYLYADWWERVGCNVMYWPWHGCPRRISQKWDNKVYCILVYICYIIPDLKNNLGPCGPPASVTYGYVIVVRGGRGSAKSAVGERERERQDTSGTSRSSANDKHLCLISVIDIEGPDKSHQVTGSKGRERLTGSSSHLERLCQSKNCMLPEILSYVLGEWKRSECQSFLFVLRALNKIWLRIPSTLEPHQSHPHLTWQFKLN